MHNSDKIGSNHKSLEVVCATVWYSVSTLDLVTRYCFLELHETKVGSKKMHDPEVDLLSSMSLANHCRCRL